MIDSLKLYGRYAAQSLKSQMEYRKSFFLQTLAQIFIIAAEFFGVWSLFSRFGNIRGWTLAEASVFYGMISIGFSISQIFSGGFETAGQLIKMGELDRILLRPRSTELQLFGARLSLRRMGRFVVGTFVLLYGFRELAWQPSIDKSVLLLWAVSGSAALFCGLMIVQASISVWTIESLEIMNTLTYGGQETGRYPVSIYSEPFRRFFTFVVPLACVNYYPVIYILGKDDPLGSPVLLQILSPAAGFLFLGAAVLFWRFALRHYKSAGG